MRKITAAAPLAVLLAVASPAADAQGVDPQLYAMPERIAGLVTVAGAPPARPLWDQPEPGPRFPAPCQALMPECGYFGDPANPDS